MAHELNHHQIDYIELQIDNFDAAETFYNAVFGWNFTDFGAHYRAFHDGRIEGGMYQGEHRSKTETGGALVVIYSADLAATKAAIIQNGGTISTENFTFPGGERFHFLDPAGNELAVWTRT